VEPEGGRGLVLHCEVGVEHRRIVGGERTQDSRLDELRQRVLLQRGHDTDPDIRHGADVEHGAALLQFLDELGVFDGADAVAQAVGVKKVERIADRIRWSQLTGVRHGAETAFPGASERLDVEMRRILELERAETDPDDAAVAVADRVAKAVIHLGGRRVSREVRREPHLHVMRLSCLLDAVAEAFVDRLPGHAATDELEGREDALDVDGSVLLGLAGVVDGDSAEVLGRAQAGGHHQPCVDEVRQIGEVEELGETFGRLGRELDAVAAGTGDEHLGTQRALEVHMKLDLRVAHRRIRSSLPARTL
jgi:hypothetical protein